MLSAVACGDANPHPGRPLSCYQSAWLAFQRLGLAFSGGHFEEIGTMARPFMRTTTLILATCPPSGDGGGDRKSTRLNSSHEWISYAVFCLKKKKKRERSADNTSEDQ